MKIFRISSLEEFRYFEKRNYNEYHEHLSWLNRILPPKESSFSVAGYSYPADKIVDFDVDFKYSNGYPNINWRERVVCPVTKLNNRMRAIIHLFDLEMGAFRDSSLYLMEQTTPVYKYFSDRYVNLIGSEFLGESIPEGEVDNSGIRNENACNLSFKDNAFEFLLSFDVFEHIPDYQLAFRECARVLLPGGKMLFSVPFNHASQENIIRAKVKKGGSIDHILPPQYHGDPLSDDGILCFQIFGWDMLKDLCRTGFSDAYAITFHSQKMGYLTNQIFFVAEK